MDNQEPCFPPALQDFVKRFEAQGYPLHIASALAVADHWRRQFCIPCPMGVQDISNLLNQLKYYQVYLQPGLERKTHTRGQWYAIGEDILMLLDAERPNASIIKTVIHELSEQLLEISYKNYRVNGGLSDRERETWANLVAAVVKMPLEKFIPAAKKHGLALEPLASEFNDTLAGVSRHIRDFVMADKVFYFCRLEIEWNPKRNCAPLEATLEETEGVCVRVVDVVKTRLTNTEGRNTGALPRYNLPVSDHYRVMHPVLHDSIGARKPLLISSLRGSASNRHRYTSLFGEDNLTFLIYPYGYSRVMGFYVIAIDPMDENLIRTQIDNVDPLRRSGMEWLFSWDSHTRERPRKRQNQTSMALDDQQFFAGLFDEAHYRWPYLKDDEAA